MFSKLKKRLAKKREMKKKGVRITKIFKDLGHHCKLTKQQKKEVQGYLDMIGKKVPPYCHE